MEAPYLEFKAEAKAIYLGYNPKYGDDRICVCGHAYYRHFDTYESMYAVGCKYCWDPRCGTFAEDREIITI